MVVTEVLSAVKVAVSGDGDEWNWQVEERWWRRSVVEVLQGSRWPREEAVVLTLVPKGNSGRPTGQL